MFLRIFNYFSLSYHLQVSIGLWHARWEFTKQLPVTLNVTRIISFVIQVDHGSPCVGICEPA